MICRLRYDRSASATKGLRRRRGVSMLELVIAGSMIAGVMTGLSFVMRTTRQSWDTVDQDYAAMQQLHAVVRHFVRSGREATEVTSIASDGTSITLDFNDGRSSSWIWQPGASGMPGRVRYQDTSSPKPTDLAGNIDQLRFTGFAADGVTPTSTPEEIQVIQISATVTVPRSVAPQKTIQSKVWIRSW